MIASLDLGLTPAGGTAVMARRVATAPDDLDYFPTPPWAARAGGELIKRLDPAARTCWEPACGQGHMAHGLADYFDTVVASDVHDYGRGQAAVCDFLGDAARDGALPSAAQNVDWIVSNPPFITGPDFVRAAMRRARVGVAMLLRLVFLEGAKRHRLLYVDCPLSVAAPFAERVPMVKGRWDPDASSATAYAWFIWDKHAARLAGGAVGPPLVMPIAPGAKARLTRPSDLTTFGPLSVAWYLDEAERQDGGAALVGLSPARAAELRAKAEGYRADARRMQGLVDAARAPSLLAGAA